jgi:diguanylate cyclase (GGDEF)-like protein
VAESPVAPDEAARLRELARYDILDTPPDGAFDDITAMAARFFAMPIAIISLVDRDRIWFKSAAGLGEVRQIARGPGLCASAILSDGITVSHDLRRDPQALANPLVARENGFRFYAAAPLRVAAGPRQGGAGARGIGVEPGDGSFLNLGTICVLDVQPRAFTPDQAAMLARFGRLVMTQMDLRLASRQIASQVQQLAVSNLLLSHNATHDEQTGLLNRGAIQSMLRTLCEQPAADRPIAVLLFDVDRFKSINDSYGHLGGDVVLVEVAKRLKAAIRPCDFVGRFGGEEFLVILVDCGEALAVQVAERIRNAVARSPVRYDNRHIDITISGGVRLIEGVAEAEATLRAADTALYAAKQAGRNRIVFA